MSEQELFKQCPDCQQFSPEGNDVCLQCGHSFVPVKAPREISGGLEGFSRQKSAMSEVEAPKKKEGGGKVVLWWLAIILAVPIIYLALGTVFLIAPDNPTASERPTYIPVATFTSTPEESTASVTAVQFDAQDQEKLSETPVSSTPVPVTPLSLSPVPSTATPRPMVTINNNMNVRGGPGTNYPIIGTSSPGQQYLITGMNPAGDWWEIDFDGSDGWVYGPLVNATNGESVRVVTRIPPTPRPPTPTRTSRPVPPTTTVPIPLSQADRAAIWISLVNHEYGFLEVFAQVYFKVDAFDMDVLVHGEEYCNDRVLYDDEPPTKLSCGILEYTHSSVSDVRVRVNEDLWSEGDRYRCERNKASTYSRSVFACERVRS